MTRRRRLHQWHPYTLRPRPKQGFIIVIILCLLSFSGLPRQDLLPLVQMHRTMGDSIAGTRVEVGRGTASVRGSVLQSNRSFRRDPFFYPEFVGCSLITYLLTYLLTYNPALLSLPELLIRSPSTNHISKNANGSFVFFASWQILFTPLSRGNFIASSICRL